MCVSFCNAAPKQMAEPILWRKTTKYSRKRQLFKKKRTPLGWKTDHNNLEHKGVKIHEAKGLLYHSLARSQNYRMPEKRREWLLLTSRNKSTCYDTCYELLVALIIISYVAH